MRLTRLSLCAGMLSAAATVTTVATATTAEEDSEQGQAEGAPIEQLVVSAERVGDPDPEDTFGLLSTPPSDLVFGLSRSLFDTPRSVSSVSEQVIDLYGVDSTNDFVSVTPGTQSASFFGVAASPDMRGSLGDVYFRGVRRLVNAGGWVTLIGATSRVDIVRGPASPIHGPGSIAGYLNFVPKTARAEEGLFVNATAGSATLTAGSWGRRQVEAEVGGPLTVLDKPAGYHLFGYREESESYYRYLRNNSQRMVQGSLVIDLTDSVWVETGFQYQKWRGAENAGWNRLTQALVDDGTYLAGSPLVNLDTNGDGGIGQAEITAFSPSNLLNIFTPYGSGIGFFENEQEREALRLDPGTVRTIQVSTRDCVCTPQDDGGATSYAFYFDVSADLGSGLELRQKLFVDYADRFIVVSYGFSQAHKTKLVEERFEVRLKDRELGPIKADFSLSPSLRYYNTRALQDFALEYFDRRDISAPPSPLNVRHASWRDPETNPYNRNTETDALDLGLAGLADLRLGRFSLLIGWRYDHYDVTSENGPDAFAFEEPGVKVSNRQGETAFNASLSAALGNFRPYATLARQPVLLGGQSGEIDIANVRTNPLNTSELKELGIKYQGLDGALFAQLSYYQQRRKQYSDQTGENLALYGTGTEFELRAALGKRLGVLLTATHAKVERRPLAGRFIFAPPSVTGFAPEDQYGGTVVTVLPAGDSRFADRGAIPESVYGAGISYAFDWGATLNLVATRVSETYSGVARTVKLPAYTLVNASISYDWGPWKLRASVKNALDERYFQGNFPHIFGDVVVLPRLPRHWQLTLTRRFGHSPQ